MPIRSWIILSPVSPMGFFVCPPQGNKLCHNTGSFTLTLFKGYSGLLIPWFGPLSYRRNNSKLEYLRRGVGEMRKKAQKDVQHNIYHQLVTLAIVNRVFRVTNCPSPPGAHGNINDTIKPFLCTRHWAKPLALNSTRTRRADKSYY